jgi:hypothetical protein
VTPTGEIIADPARGTMMGNRGGAFHRPDQTLGRRRWASRQWICCRLAFKDRRRAIMQPGRYTELFFLDEATALAAGHRPCFECRRHDAERFRHCFARAHGLVRSPSAPDMDRQLHGERTGDGSHSRRSTEAAALPPGVMVLIEDVPHLVLAGRSDAYVQLARWSLAGYAAPIEIALTQIVPVLTPPNIVAVAAVGYPIAVHPSAAEPLRQRSP